MKKIIEDFLKMYGILVSENEDDAIVELMMDNHKCVVWSKLQYYVPEDTAYSEEDELVYEYLTSCHHC